MTKLLHISDVHIGKAFTAFGNKAPHLRKAQLVTLRNVAKIGGERGVSAILVSGDLFDSNTVGKLLNDVQTIIRASGLKFYILPGAGERGISGHDALEPGSVYYRDGWSSVPNAFIFRKEGGEFFYDATSGIAFYGKPTRHGESPLPLIERHKEANYHVALAHGSVRFREEFSDYPIEPGDISASGFDYIALGHWHQTSDFSSGNTCAWYPGSPEILESDRTGKGCALLVDLHGQGPASVETIEVGQFLWAYSNVDAASDPALIADVLRARYPDPELTILKVKLAGTAKSEDVARLKQIITEKLTGMFDLTFDASRVMEEIDPSKYPEDSVIGQFVRIMNNKIGAAGVDDRHHLEEALRLGMGLMTGNMDRKSINLEDLLR